MRHAGQVTGRTRSGTVVLRAESRREVGQEGVWLVRGERVGLRGLEPRASSLSGTRSNRLSYNPMYNWLTCGNRSDNYPTAPVRRVVPWFSQPPRYSVSRSVTSTPPTSRDVRS